MIDKFSEYSRGRQPHSFLDALTYWTTFIAFQQQWLRVPGIQVAVFADGELVTASFGHADLGQGIALSDTHLCRIASQSKVFTAVAVMQLAEDGAVHLDEASVEYVPSLAGSPLARVTVRQLLAHTGGIISDGPDGDYWLVSRPAPDRDELVAIARGPGAAVFEPNTRFKYSNIGYGLLGLIIEAASGESFAQQVRRRIVEPLGLTNTGVGVVPELAERHAVGYGGLHASDHRRPIDNADTAAMDPAGGLYSTARDVVRFFATFLPGDETLLQEESKHRMISAARETDWPYGARYGLGLEMHTVGGRDLVGHPGGFPGFRSQTLADLSSGLVVSVIANAIGVPAEDLTLALFKLLDLAASSPKAAAASGDPSRFTGRFANLYGVLDIAELGGRLYALDPTTLDPAGSALGLEVVDGTTLRFLDGEYVGELIPYEFCSDGTVRSVRTFFGATMTPFQHPSAVAADSTR